MKRLLIRGLFNLAFLLLAGIHPSFAQPANDNCSGAVSVLTDSTCYNGTTVGANDSWLGTVGCQSNGSHPDAWYTFTATGTSLSVSVTGGTITGNIEFILVAATGNCTGFTLAGSICGPSPLSGNITGLQPGTTYYYTISSDGNTGTFTACVKNTSPATLSGQDCSTAAILCNSTSVSQSTSNAGFGTQEVSPANSCWGINGERQSRWFKFTIGCSGTLEFNINPVSSADDYDWALWNITSNPSNCSNKGNSIACNWSGCTGSTGISSCAASEPGVQSCGQSTGGDPCGGGNRPRAWTNWSAPGGGASTCLSNTLNVTAGSTYALLVDNFSVSNSGFTLIFGGACGGGTAKIGPNAEFTYVAGTCGTYTFTKTCQTANSTFFWSFGDGNTSTQQNPTHTYSTAGSFTISLQVTDALGCIDTYSQTINIQAVPVPTVTTPPVLYCQGASASPLTATGAGSLVWYTTATGGTGSSAAPVPSTATPGTTAYYVSQIINGCESQRVRIDVIVSAAPVMTSAATASFCSGTTFTINLSSNIPAIYSWVAADNPQTTGETLIPVNSSVINNTIINNTQVAQVVQYSVTPSSAPGGCPGVTQVINVTINPNPELTIPLSQNICSGSPLNISLSSTAAGTSFTWVAVNNPNTAGESLTPQTSSSINDVINNPTLANQNITYTVNMIAGPCVNTQDITITVFPKPLMTSTGSINGCNGVFLNIPFSATVPSTYTWIATDNPNVTGESTTLQTTGSLSNTLTLTAGTNTPQVITYSVTPTSVAGGCTGPTQTVTVTINPIPSMTSAASTTICSGDNVNFPLTASVPSLFTWIATNNNNVTGESTTGQNGATINNTLVNNTATAQTVVYSVTPRSVSGNCQGTVQYVSVIVNPSPQASYSGTTTICSGEALNLSISSNTPGASFSWSATDNNNTTGESTTIQNTASITDAISNQSSTPQTVVYTANAAFGGCPSPPLLINVTVNPVLRVTNANNLSICSNTSVGLSFTGNIPGMSFSWQATGNGNVNGESTTLQTSSSITDVLVNTTSSPEVVQYTVTGAAGSCPGSPQSVNVTVLPAPGMSSGNAITTCSGIPLNFQFISNIPSAFSWIAADNPNTTGESLAVQTSPVLNDIILNNTTTAQQVIYTVTPSSVSGNCPGSPQNITVTVNPAPQMTSQSAATICSGQSLNIQLTGSIPSSFTWVAANNNSTIGESTVTQNSSLINDAITNLTGSPQTITYTVTPTSSATGCTGTAQTVLVTVNSTGSPNFAYPLSSYCQNGNDPVPSISGTLGGVFSATPAGLSINPGSGLITLGSSAVNTYTITYTVGNPCPSSATFTLSVTASPNAAFSYPTPLCAAAGASTVFPTPNTGNTDLYFSLAGLAFISNRTGEINPAASIPGTYVVQHTIPAVPGCNPAFANFTVTIVGLPTPAAAGIPQTVCGNSATLAGNAPVSGSGSWSLISGSGNISNPSQPDAAVTGLSNGNNTFRWTIATAAPCPSSSSDVVITSLPASLAAYSYPNYTYCIGSANPTATITGTTGGSFTASPAGMTINSSTGTIDLGASAPGTYTITYAITGSCPASKDTLLTIVQAPTAGFTYNGTPFCQNSNNPVPTLAAGASAGIFSASPAGLVFVNTGTGEVDLLNSSPGTYTVTNFISAANGCAAVSSTATISIIAAPSASNAGPLQVICSSNAVLNGNTPFNGSGLWTLVSGTGIIANPSSPTTGVSGLGLGNNIFRWTITGNPPCPASSSDVTITNITGPQMTSPAALSICSGQPVNLQLTSDVPANYQWIASDNPSTFGESLNAQNSSIINDVIVSASVAPQTVNYTVTPTTASGCPGTSQNIAVTVNPVPQYAGPVSASICSGATASIALSANMPATFTWQAADNVNVTGESLTPQSSSIIDNTLQHNSAVPQNVIYTVIPMALTGGCSGSGQPITITVNPLPSITNQGNYTVCSGTALNIIITANMQAAFSWIAADNPNTTGESLTVQNGTVITDVINNPTAASQIVSYSVTPVSQTGNCQGSPVAFNIMVFAPDNSSFNYPLSVICQAGAIQSPTITGLAGGTFTATPAGLNISSSNGNINPAASSTGSYTIAYSTNGNCPTTTNAQITITNTPIASFGYSGPFCNSATNPLPVLTPGAAAGSFSATPAGLVFANTNTGEINLAASMEGTYTVTNTISASANCPAASANATVAIIQAPSVSDAGSPQSICGTAAALNATNPVFGSGTWTVVSGGGVFADPNSPSSGISNLLPGPNVFQWTVETNPPCPATTSQVTITAIPKPEMTGPTTAMICSGGTTAINLTSNIPSTFTWSATDNPNTTGESTGINTAPVISNTILNLNPSDQQVIYTVTPVSVAGNCSGNPQTIYVMVLAPPRINAGRDTIAILNQPHQLLASGGNSYIWSPSAPLNNAFIANPLATLSNDTRFIVEGSNAIGCKGYDTVFVKVYQGPAYYVPNAFTPNGDGLNDLFTPIPVGIVSTDWFRIYNRYGQLIFESSEWLKGWDGRYRGVNQPTGAYVWIIKGKSVTGQEISAKGTVLLIH